MAHSRDTCWQVSGGIFLGNLELRSGVPTSKLEVPKALISGISAGLSEAKTDGRPDNQYNVTFQFAYDEDVFKIASDQLTETFGRV
jgi:hypothetical protein